MRCRSVVDLLLAACCVALAVCPSVKAASEDGAPAKAGAVEKTTVEKPNEPSVQYLPFDAPAGMSQAVVVEGVSLVHTRQLLPFDGEGKLVGQGAADKQIEQVLANLEAVLKASGSGLDKLVRLNVYAMSHQTADRLREQLAKRLDASVRPAITAILTPFSHREALVAVDAVAVAAEKGVAVGLKRCEGVFGDKDCADAAVLPRGGVAYLSGQPERGGLAASAVAESLGVLFKRLEPLKLSPSQVVQVKVFLMPATSAEAALAEVKRLFPGQLAPPVVFVEWIASAPVEIELIVQLPLTGEAGQTVDFYNPPELKASANFSRVALVRTERQIYISGLTARAAGDGEAQARDVFEQFKAILAETGSDLKHLAKATYYVSEDDGSRGIDKMRPEFFDPARPPAASKVTVHAVGRKGRSLAIDMIAVGKGE